MSLYLGIDTSNYTTSAALYNAGNGSIIQSRKLLPVKPGEKGLRQSDAVFHHTVQLPQVLSELSGKAGGLSGLTAVGVSSRPRNIDGSYMPCFLVGLGTAKAIVETCPARCYEFSHQEGHIAAALYSSGRLDLMNGRFIAFHVSGGTTEAVMAEGNGKRFRTTLIAKSLDLKAGQAIDRTAVMLGLPFPGGVHLEKLALSCDEEIRVRPSMKGCDCSLSGIENKCIRLLQDGYSKEYIAKFCIMSVMSAITSMTDALIREYGGLPIIYAGGVMSDAIIQKELSARYEGAFFASPEFSCDNAAGTAILASLSDKEHYQ